MSRFIWLGNRVWEAECICHWFEIAFSITLECHQSTIPGISLEKILGSRRFWGSHDLFDSILWAEAASRIKDEIKGDLLLSYAPLPTNKICPFKPLWQVSPHLHSLWNDKIQTRQWFSANGLPTYPFMKVDGSNWPSYSGLLVLQGTAGSCGFNTYVGNAENLRSFFYNAGWAQALVTPFINGWVINGHILIFKNGRIEIPWPSMQLVNQFTENGYARPIYAGNDFLAYQEFIPEPEKHYISELLHKLGELAAQKGFVGILGADLLYDPEGKTVGILEINPRLQGSTGLLAQLELSAGIIPAAARMFLSLLGQEVAPVEYPALPHSYGIYVSQYIVRNQMPPDILFDNQACFKYGKAVYNVTQKLVPRERILIDRSIFSPNFAGKDEFISCTI